MKLVTRTKVMMVQMMIVERGSVAAKSKTVRKIKLRLKRNAVTFSS